MKKYLKKNVVDLSLLLLFSGFILFSWLFTIPLGLKIKDNFMKFLAEMLGILPLMFILISLFDVWFPKEKIEKHIGRESGIKGIIWIILLAMLQAGPLYGAFPVACLLWKKGAGIRNIFIYLGAFSTLKIPMLVFETSFLGWRFSLLRTLISLPVFIAIAIVMEKYLKNKNFEVKEPAE